MLGIETLTLEERKKLNRRVIRRDKRLCILTGKPAVDVAHIIPRSHGRKNSAITWQEKNMCCLCRDEHIETRSQRIRLLKRMKELYKYDYSDPPFSEYDLEEKEKSNETS